MFDITDDFEGATKLSPSDFARYIGVKPQLVHYYVRQGVLVKEWCVCGRYVIDIEEGVAALQARKKARRRDVEAFPDAGRPSGPAEET